MKKLAVVLACCYAYSGAALSQQCQNPTPVWEDNFDGTSFDTSKWESMDGDGCSYGICGWGNNELQHYKAENATVANGILTIEAKKERVRGARYTSARLRTANMPNGGQWTNGRFEARIKLPDGAGMWPAFWMLPTDPDIGWPMSGEIDIMEATGQADMFAFGTIHYGQPWPENEFSGNRILKQPDAWSDDFHVYAVEWEPNEMRWYVDDLLYSVKRPQDLSDSSFWTFENYQYHFLLNLAVGGNIGGTVDDSALPQTMHVDYVRVYDLSQPSLSGEHLVEPNSVSTLSVIDQQGNATYSWSVPAGASIVSGASSDTVTIQWGTDSGAVSVAVNDDCGQRTLSQDVYVSPVLSPQLTHDDFESNRGLTYTSFEGSFNQASSNPGADSVNSSAVVGHYQRNSASLYDVIVADISSIADVQPYLSGDKAFFLDLYTDAPVGTEILIQLENSSTATPDNYPTGRHSKYVAHVEAQNQWQQLKFTLEDRIDGGTSDADVNSLVILFALNTLSSDNYFWDNLATHGVGTSAPNQNPIASFVSSCTDLVCSFDGTASSDSDGSIASYAWDFGDGNSASTASPEHTFAFDGSYQVSLTVTDDDGAVSTSTESVTVTSGSTGTPTSMSISSVTTGTSGAGRGAKYATATVQITDDLGNPVSNVTVTGNFSGTIVENNVTGQTDGSGSVTLTTSSAASGKLDVSFCVSSLSHASLSYDGSSGIGLCQ